MKKNLLLLATSLLVFFTGARAQTESDIVISEFLYNQPGQDTLEFVELYNKGTVSVNLEGYSFTSGFSYTFPNYLLNSGETVVIARYPNYFNNFFAGVNAIKWESGGLDNSGEKIVLKDAQGNIADSIDYSDSFPWPEKADGEGTSAFSLELCNVDLDNSVYESWNTSNTFKGMYSEGGMQEMIFASPGIRTTCQPLGDIVEPEVDRITATDPSTIEIVYSEPVTNGGVLANYTGISVSGVDVSDSQTEVELTLSSPLNFGERYPFYVQGIEDQVGNVIENKSYYVGYNNTNPALFFSEIFYDQPGTDTLEFIELYYDGEVDAELGGLTFNEGIEFTFPKMTVEPGQYIILAESPLAVEEFFGISDVIAWHDGSLNNGGEKLLITNAGLDTIDYVDYNDTAPWPLKGAGQGSSIVYCRDKEENFEATSWFASNTFARTFDGYPLYANPGVNEVCVLGVKDNNSAAFSLGPNPSNGTFALESETQNVKLVKVFDMKGRLVYSTSFTSDINVKLPEAEKGIFLVRVLTEEGNLLYNEKVIVK